MYPGLNGVFYINSRTSPSDVPDGLSNTAFVSEIRAVPGEDFRGILHYPEGPIYHHNYTPNSSVPDEIRKGYCVSVPGDPCDDSLFQSYSDRQLTMTAKCSSGRSAFVAGRRQRHVYQRFDCIESMASDLHSQSDSRRACLWCLLA